MGKERSPFTCQAVATHFRGGRVADHRRTALREAAYIRRTRFIKGGAALHDFSCRAEDLFMLMSIIPDGAPDWARRPFLRWQFADEAVEESGKVHGVRAWHVCGDLRPGLSRGAWTDAVEMLVRNALPTGVLAEIAGHIPADGAPPHVHILVSSHYVGDNGYTSVAYPLYRRLTECLRPDWLAWLTS